MLRMTKNTLSNLGFREGFAIFKCLNNINSVNVSWLSVVEYYHNSSQVVRVFEHQVIHTLQRVVSYLKEGKC